MITELTVPGFESLIASVPVDPLNPSTLTVANYTGKLRLPNPPYTVIGTYNPTTNTIILKRQILLPFGGLSLVYQVEVDILHLQIVQQYFYGLIQKPLFMEVTGTYDSINCHLYLSGMIHDISDKNIDVTTSVLLSYCDDCTSVCSAESVNVSVSLIEPWMITLNGSYSLDADNVTSIFAGGSETTIQGIDLDIFVIIESTVNQFSFEQFKLVLHLPNPFAMNIEGSYSKEQAIAYFSGSLSTEIIDLSITLTADIAADKLSTIHVAGSILSPFMLDVEGAYKLSSSNTSSNNLVLMGELEIENFFSLSITTRFHLPSRSFSAFAFNAFISVPLETKLSAHYESLDTDIVDIKGSIQLVEGYSIMVSAQVNLLSQPMTIESIEISGAFPYPFNGIQFKGLYDRECSCAMISGGIVKDDFHLTLSTNVDFVQGELASIDTVNVSITFNRPSNLYLTGIYRFSNNSNAVLSVNGRFDIPYISLNVMVLALIEGMSTVEVLKLSFSGTFPPPLNLMVNGNFESENQELVLTGLLKYSFATLNASTTYLFLDDMHNQSAAMVSDVTLTGQLISPFPLNVQGLYKFSNSKFTLQGSISPNNHLHLVAKLDLNTSFTPPRLDFIYMSGHLMAPIPFQTDFQGIYDISTHSANLTSTLMLGNIALNAVAQLMYLPSETSEIGQFELQSIQIMGSLDFPLKIQVAAVYEPTETEMLMLKGNMEISSVSFDCIAYARIVNGSNSLSLDGVYFEGFVHNPFMLKLSGNYKSGDMLMLGASLELNYLTLSVTTTVNLATTPREISSYSFKGKLSSPFNSVLLADYTSGELILRGAVDLAALHFKVQVIMETSPNLTVSQMIFQTTYHPLNLKLIGIYNRQENRMDLIGSLNISSIEVEISSFINLDTLTLGDFALTIDFSNPPLRVTGYYRKNTKRVHLHGFLPIGPFKLQVNSVIHLGNPTSELEEIKLLLNYTIPFGRNLFFLLEGDYNTERNSLLFLKGSIADGSSSDLINCLLVLSKQEPHIYVTSLYIKEIDIGALLNTYLGISWPFDSFPLLVFKNVAVYKSDRNFAYDNIMYREGFHARGEVKFLFLPTMIIDAFMSETPFKRFEVRFTVKEVIDWNVIALCNAEDTTCDKSGPSLAIIYKPHASLKIFEISGGLKLFGVRIGNVYFTVQDEVSKAFVSLSDSLFAGILPEKVTVYWTDKGFYTNLRMPNLRIPNFKLQNTVSQSICEKLGGYISELAIDVPFDLRGTLLVRLLENGTVSFGAAIQGIAQIEIADKSVYTAKINLFVIEIILSPGEICTWQCFVDAIEKGIKESGPRIIDELLNDPAALAAVLAGKLGEKVIGKAAEALCDKVLETAIKDVINAVQTPAPIPPGVVGTVNNLACLIAKIFGECSKEDNGGKHEKELEEINENLRQTCDENSLCEQKCDDSSGTISCSCNEGCYLGANGYSCICKYLWLIYYNYNNYDNYTFCMPASFG